jgi:uracil-DNA glycosylase family 4
MEALVKELAAARIGATFNQYAEGERAPLLRARLTRYLEERSDAPVLLVGEAAGYRGARVSGLPFTSERQLTGEGPAEATATLVHGVLASLGLQENVLLWNVVPTHPGTERSNRQPTREEVESGIRFTLALARGRRLVAVGRVAESALGAPYVRHPSHGGAAAFGRGLAAAVASAGFPPCAESRDVLRGCGSLTTGPRKRARLPFAAAPPRHGHKSRGTVI